MKNLLECKFNREYVVKEIDKSLPLKVRRRLLELGFTRGTLVTLVRASSLKKAYLITLRGYTLSLRAHLARAVMIDD